MAQIQLDCSAILQVPLDKFPKDFTFIVNGEKFQTSKLISNLLSPLITKSQAADPTFDVFTIETKEKGHFSQILQLIDFNANEILYDEIPFISEVLEILKNDKIIIKKSDKKVLTNENVITEILNHERYSQFFSENYEEEIEFISSNFSEIIKTQKDGLIQLKLETLERIINNDHLSIDTEDDLLLFINELCLNDSKYSILYENVYFDNVTTSTMKEFISIFDLNEITSGVWNQLCKRLIYSNIKKTRKGMKFEPNEDDPFNGIIEHFRTQSKDVNNEIQTIESSCSNTDEEHQSKTILMKENPESYFATKGIQNSWVGIDFKDHRIIPTHYTIRSSHFGLNDDHLKGWIIEVSNDNRMWEEIDEVNDCQYLNGSRFFHTFKINKEQTSECRYFRIRQPGKNWGDSNQIVFESLEIYGTLI